MLRAATPVETAAERYLELKRSLGRAYAQEGRVLASVCEFLAAAGREELTQELFSAWAQQHSQLNANTRRYRQRVVRNFCLYRRRFEPGCFVPDASQFPNAAPHALPVIFGPSEVTRMLAAATKLTPTNNSPLHAEVLHLAVVLLYTAGLRRGELLRLTLADTDVEQGTIFVRESKFYKSRTVPLSISARDHLRAYLGKRLAAPLRASPESTLLCNLARGQRGYTGTGISRGLKELFKTAGVQGADGRLPRVHDFRHSFAVQALLRWYRAGEDVQSNLPKLALYMGHVSIASTAYYLKLVPEIAAAASDRFEAQFGHLISGGEA